MNFRLVIALFCLWCCVVANNLNDFSLTFPLDFERYEPYGNIANAADSKSLFMSGYPSKATPLLFVSSLWSKDALPSFMFSKDNNWELHVTIVQHSSEGADHEHGFGVWLAEEVSISREVQWGVDAKLYSGLGVFVAEFGDFADTSSQIVDVYGAIGRGISLISDDENDDYVEDFVGSRRADDRPHNRAHCSINSWDVSLRESQIILRKDGDILTVKFSSCDDFELDMTPLTDAAQQNQLPAMFAGISFWSRSSTDESVQILRFNFRELSQRKTANKSIFDSNELEKSTSPDSVNIFNYPHREMKIETLSLTYPYESSACLKKDKQLVSLTSPRGPSAGALWSSRSLERRLFDVQTAWQLEIVVRNSFEAASVARSGFLVWLSNEKPNVISNNSSNFCWNGTFNGFAVMVRMSGVSPMRQFYVLTVNGKGRQVTWGSQPSKLSNYSGWGVKCIVDEKDIFMPNSGSLIVRTKKQGTSIYVFFAPSCMLVFALTSILPQGRTVPLYKIGVGAWTDKGAPQEYSVQSISFSEVLRVTPSKPTFLSNITSDEQPIQVVISAAFTDDVYLNCETSWVYPKPKITWTRRNELLGEQMLTHAEDQQVLPVLQASFDDVYSCTVVNELGNISRTFRIARLESFVAKTKRQAGANHWVATISFLSGVLVVVFGSALVYLSYRRRKVRYIIGQKSGVGAPTATRQLSRSSDCSSSVKYLSSALKVDTGFKYENGKLVTEL